MKIVAEFVEVRTGRRYRPDEGDAIDPPLDAEQIKRLVKAECLTEGGEGVPTLRRDGPTIAEFVSAGYRADAYPPRGYASKSSPEEIAAAVAAQAKGSDLEGMTVAELRDHAKASGIEIPADVTKKADIVALLKPAVESN